MRPVTQDVYRSPQRTGTAAKLEASPTGTAGSWRSPARSDTAAVSDAPGELIDRTSRTRQTTPNGTRKSVTSSRFARASPQPSSFQQSSALHFADISAELARLARAIPSAESGPCDALVTQCYKATENARSSVSYPLTLSPVITGDLLQSLLSLISAVHPQLKSAEANHRASTTPNEYMRVEQCRLSLSSLLQYLHLLLHKRQILVDQLSEAERRRLIETTLTVIEAEMPPTSDSDDSDDQPRSWALADALRVIHALLHQNPSALAPYYGRLIIIFNESLQARTQTNDSPYVVDSQSDRTSVSGSNSAPQLESVKLSLACVGQLAPTLDTVTRTKFIARYIASIEQTLRGSRSSSNVGHTSTTTAAFLAATLDSLLTLLSAEFAVESKSGQASKQTNRNQAQPTPNSTLEDADVVSLLTCLHRLIGWAVPLTFNDDPSAATSAAATGISTADGASSADKPIGRAPSQLQQSASHSFSPFASPTIFTLSQRTTAQTQAKPADDSTRLYALTERCRGRALECLILNGQYRLAVFHQHWLTFLPLDLTAALSTRPFSGAHLATVILYDPAPSNRAQAAHLLSLLIPNSPLARFIQVGGKGGIGTRFREVSRGLHAALLAALKKEVSQSVITALVKAVAVTARHVPYAQLEPASGAPLLTPIVEHIALHLLPTPSVYAINGQYTPARSHSRVSSTSATPSRLSPSSHSRSIGGRALAASFYSSAAQSSTLGFTTELRLALFASLIAIFAIPANVEVQQFFATDSQASSRLIIELINHARTRRSNDPVPDAWLVLATIARYHRHALLPFWLWNESLDNSSLGTLLITALFHPTDVTLAVAALNFLEEWTRTDTANRSDGDNDEEESESAVSPFWSLSGASDIAAQHLLLLYDQLRDPTLTPASAANTGRARAIGCLSFLPSQSWIALTAANQLSITEIIRRAAGDSASAVRMASCRALATFVGHHSQSLSPSQADRLFVLEAVNLLIRLLSSHESVVLVRTRAAWAIANLCESANSAPLFWPLLPVASQIELLAALIEATRANDKIAANAVRGLGNAARWLPLTGDALLLESLVTSLADTLNQPQRAAKCRWNAAYALGNVLANTQVEAVLLAPVYETLLVAIQDPTAAATAGTSASQASNFKVRINAALALGQPHSRVAFGTALPRVVEQLISACQSHESRVSIRDVKQSRYHEQLKAQTKLALFHALSHTDANDTERLGSVIVTHSAFLAQLALKERLRLYSEARRAALPASKRTNTTAATPLFPAPSTALVDTAVNGASQVLSAADRDRFVAAANGE